MRAAERQAIADRAKEVIKEYAAWENWGQSNARLEQEEIALSLSVCCMQLLDLLGEVDPTIDVSFPADDTLQCDQCGEPMVIGPNDLEPSEGVSHHLTSTGEIDHERDADHVPYTAEAE